jgi:hypothetical protein
MVTSELLKSTVGIGSSATLSSTYEPARALGARG